MTAGHPEPEARSRELDPRLDVPKDDARLLWLFTTILVLLATLVPYVTHPTA